MNSKIQKGQNPTTTSEAPGAKAGYCAWALYTTPPKGSADLLSHPSHLPNPLIHPHFHPLKEPGCPLGEPTGSLLLVVILLCCGRSPNKALPEFLFWPLINSYWNFCWLESKDPSRWAQRGSVDWRKTRGLTCSLWLTHSFTHSPNEFLSASSPFCDVLW